MQFTNTSLANKVKNLTELWNFVVIVCIFSLEDENPSTRETIWKLWGQIGKKWVEDEATRDEKMKEQLDFQGASEPPTHFPSDSKK